MIIFVSLLLVVSILLLVLAACGSKDALAGTWTGDLGPDGVVTWTFDGSGIVKFDNGFSKQCDPDWLPMIDQTVSFLGRYMASQLSNWSHKSGSPWDRATAGGKELQVQIPNEFIREYFSKMVSHAKPTA